MTIMKKIIFLLLVLICAPSFAQGVKKVKTDVLDTNVTTTSATFTGTTLSFTMDSTRAADTTQIWMVEGCLFTGSSAASGISLGFALATNDTADIVFIGTDSTISQLKSSEVTTDSAASASFNNANAQTGKIWLKGTVVAARGGAKKTFTLLFKKLTSGTATLRRKSWIKAERIR